MYSVGAAHAPSVHPSGPHRPRQASDDGGKSATGTHHLPGVAVVVVAVALLATTGVGLFVLMALVALKEGHSHRRLAVDDTRRSV